MVKYVVQPGDTLGTIAGKYETSVEAIARVNGIRNPDRIHAGQILKIPDDMDNNHGYHHSGHHHHKHGHHMHSYSYHHNDNHYHND